MRRTKLPIHPLRVEARESPCDSYTRLNQGVTYFIRGASNWDNVCKEIIPFADILNIRISDFSSCFCRDSGL